MAHQDPDSPRLQWHAGTPAKCPAHHCLQTVHGTSGSSKAYFATASQVLGCRSTPQEPAETC